jgi:hypothetical protein
MMFNEISPFYIEYNKKCIITKCSVTEVVHTVTTGLQRVRGGLQFERDTRESEEHPIIKYVLVETS